MHIIIASDSRGRGFPQYIQSHQPFPLHWKISLLIRPGATIEKLTRETENILKLENNSQSTNVMFFAGICNLTEQINHQFGTEICYHSYQKVQNTIQAINQSFQKLQTFNCKVQYATISPVSLTSYINYQQKKGNLLKSIHQFEQITYQQKSLENDIIQINVEICKLNTLNGTSSIRLDKDVTKFSTKKRGRNGGNRKKVQNFQYDNFYDGVHPNAELANKWFLRLTNALIFDINDCEKCNTSGEDEEEEGVNEDTWDFKRKI